MHLPLFGQPARYSRRMIRRTAVISLRYTRGTSQYLCPFFVDYKVCKDVIHRFTGKTCAYKTNVFFQAKPRFSFPEYPLRYQGAPFLQRQSFPRPITSSKSAPQASSRWSASSSINFNRSSVSELSE